MDCTIENRKKSVFQSGDEFGDIMLTGKSYLIGERRIVEFICCCGKINWGRLDSIKSNRIKSCGCRKSKIGTLGVSKRKITKHGLCDHIIYTTWDGMIQRCTNHNSNNFPNYGGRGVSVCSEWLNSFEAFYKWSIGNGWQKGLSLDRIDNDGNYEPSNCRWTTPAIQSRNKRNTDLITAFGESKCAVDWYNDDRCVVSKNVIIYRIKIMGWDAERAITTNPIENKRDNGRFIKYDSN